MINNNPQEICVDQERPEFSLPPLESFDVVRSRRPDYIGPTDESNWVIPEILLVGAYPSSLDDEENFQILSSLLNLKVTTFVCLQQEYVHEGVTEIMWRRGDYLRPYFKDAVEIAKQLGMDSAKLSLVHFPIEDCGVADDDRLGALARHLERLLRGGEVMYLHCWGGHGRTGMVVCLLLHLLYNLDAEQAMKRCQFLHDLRKIPVPVGSPQTEQQRQQVRRVVRSLSSNRQKEDASPSNTFSVHNHEDPKPKASVRNPRSFIKKSMGYSFLNHSKDSKQKNAANLSWKENTPSGGTLRRQLAAPQAPAVVTLDARNSASPENSSRLLGITETCDLCSKPHSTMEHLAEASAQAPASAWKHQHPVPRTPSRSSSRAPSLSEDQLKPRPRRSITLSAPMGLSPKLAQGAAFAPVRRPYYTAAHKSPTRKLIAQSAGITPRSVTPPRTQLEFPACFRTKSSSSPVDGSSGDENQAQLQPGNSSPVESSSFLPIMENTGSQGRPSELLSDKRANNKGTHVFGADSFEDTQSTASRTPCPPKQTSSRLSGVPSIRKKREELLTSFTKVAV